MKTPKLKILVTAGYSVAAFLLQNLILCASFLKFNDRAWNFYKWHGNTYDLILFGAYCLMFVISWAVWFCANISFSKRFLIAGFLFAINFVVSVICVIAVSFIYGVAVGGY
jgi:hypothetical protein